MARVILNTALSRASGRVGDIEFRRHHGTMVLQKRQQRVAPWSRPQQRQRGHFKSHTDYAATVRADSGARAAYAAAGARRKRRLNYWQMALRDRATPPEISRFLLRDFRPATGGCVAIEARDDFMVARVHVTVRDSEGAVLGHGEAKLVSGEWQHVIPPPSAGASPAASVVVTVFDRPGNFAVGTFSLSGNNSAES